MAWILNFKNASARALAIALGVVGLMGGAEAAPKEAIDRIEVLGVTAVPESVVNALFQDDLAAGIDGLKKAYADRGYRRVRIGGSVIRVRTGAKSELVMRVSVAEGAPLRISGVELAEARRLDKSRPQVWASFVAAVEPEILVHVGGNLTAERKKALERAVDRELVAGEYIGAKVVEVEEVPVTDYEIKLRVTVQLGDAVTFGFRGNMRLTRQDLMQLIDEMRTAGFSDDYEEAIRRRIVEAYQSRAYLQAKVAVQTAERPLRGERHLTFIISEGQRTQIGEIRFEGQSSFSDGALLSQLNRATSEVVKSGYFVDSDLKKAADQTVDWMRSQGYLSARLISVQSSFRRTSKMPLADVVITVNEGGQTLLRKVTFEGLHALTPEQARDALHLTEGRPLNLFAFTEGLEALAAEYRNRAFLEFRYLNEDDASMVRYSSKDQFADITVKIQEGPEIRVSSIEYEGLGGTAVHVLEREMELKEGELLREADLRSSERRIRQLGIFATTRIEARVEADKPGFRRIRVLVTEGNPGRVSGGLGFRNDLGIRVFGEASYGNLFGQNHTLSLGTAINRRIEDYCRTRTNIQTGIPQTACFTEYELKLAYLWPWIGFGQTTFRPDITLEHRRYFQFDAETVALTVTLERELVHEIRLTGSLAYSLERTRQENAVQDTDNQTLTIGSITPTLRVDFRDNALDPHRGFFAWTSFDYASPLLGSQSQPLPVSYARVQFRADQHVPIGVIDLFFSFRAGYERNLTDPADPSISAALRGFVGVPLIKQFALGGVGSLRGFNIQEINAQDRVIQGSLSYVNYRFQAELPVSGNLKFGPFLDAGNLRVDSFSFGGLRYGSGVGLRYRSPVGPINFDWGFKLDPAPTDVDWNRFYFSIGIL